MNPATNPGSGTSPPDLTMDLNPNFYTQFALGLQFMPDAVKGFFALGKLVLNHVLTLYSLPLEVYLRWRWGLRAMGAFQVCSLCALAALSFLLGGLLSLFLVGSAGLALWHYLEARRWEVRHPGGPRWRLTYSFGEPRVWSAIVERFARRGRLPSWGNPFTIFRFLEPATGLALGALLAVTPVTRLLGLLLLVSGAALLVKRHLIYMRHVEETRDRRDAIAIGVMLGAEADAERGQPDPQEAFEVRLAVAAPSQVVPLAPVPVLLPALQEKPASSSPAVGRVRRGPDANNRVAVECPHCTRLVRCPPDRGAGGVKCPSCARRFVFAIALEQAS